MRARTHLASLLFSSSVLAVAACGGGGNDVDPTLLPGGGVADPGIDGEVNVYVIVEATGAPLAGATVVVGAARGETDATGLFVATGVTGPQTITVIADGYTPATWVGVDGANVTIPVNPPTEPPVGEVPQGTAAGTIDGFIGRDIPQGKIANIAFVGFSGSRVDDDPGNDLQQPEPPMGQPPPNFCLDAGGMGASCDWDLVTRTGPQTIYAYLGSADASFNVELTGFAYASGLDVSDGEDLTGVALEIVPEADLETPAVSLPTAPAGTDGLQAFAQLDVGVDGFVPFPVTGDVQPPVPKTSAIAGSSYQVVAIAETDAAGDADQSIAIVRGLTTLTDAAVPTLLPLPTGVQTDGATYSLQPVPDASLHLLAVTDGAGTSLWGAVVFDGSTEVALPADVVLQAGSKEYFVQALELPGFDPQQFRIDDFDEGVTRLSATSASFGN